MILLKIKNLILVESQEIHLGPHLNILTGETGSGKSAILTAIRLIAGERADSEWIRNGADSAVVELQLPDSTWIRREMYRSGKNRCFIDDEQVSLSALKERIPLEIVDQNSSAILFEEQKRLFDHFSQLVEKVKDLEESFLEEKKILESILQKKEKISEERLKKLEEEMEQLEALHFKEGEETLLNEEHRRLFHVQEIGEKLQFALSMLEGEERNGFKKALQSVEACTLYDAKLQSVSQTLQSALVEINEAAHLISSYIDQLDVNPFRFQEVEKRIAVIEWAKKKYGPNLFQLTAQKKQELQDFLKLSDEILSLEQSHAALSKQNKKRKEEILFIRKEKAPLFAQKVLEQLLELNIAAPLFEVKLGRELNEVEFLFSANGATPLPLKKCASGGELSRLLLAIKTISSDENKTLVFDEIDSNVGGQTAAVLGQKLALLARSRQVICVTHFVQVAKWATDHFLVSKHFHNGSMATKIEKLGEKEKEMEYSRMLGQKT